MSGSEAGQMETSLTTKTTPIPSPVPYFCLPGDCHHPVRYFRKWQPPGLEDTIS